MKIYIHTLGCKVNQYESQAIEAILKSKGHELCSKDDDFDAFIVNTCAVTAESGRKSRQIIRQLKASHPDAICAVCGCYSQISPQDVEDIGADVLFGSGDRLSFIQALISAYEKKTTAVSIDEPLKRRVFEVLPAGNIGTRTRATLKIEDGCSNFCSYCIIPYARGPVRSLPLEEIKSQAESLYAGGYKEIIITGIEIASYGKDLKDGETLSDAISAIAQSAPGVRLHLGSLEVRCITEELVSTLASLGTVCPHFHLSLQSGCDETLRRMNRKYGTDRFYEATVLLRKYFPDCSITADLITGFPGETQEEFEKTLEFIQKCRFSYIHVFPYSVRPGTVAAKMDGQVPNSVKHERAKTVSEICEKMHRQYLEMWMDKTLSVLFETESDGMSLGHSENYLPVAAEGKGLHNIVKTVKITGVDGDRLTGLILN